LPEIVSQPTVIQGVEIPDELRHFNHEWMINLCIIRCIQNANDPQGFQNAVAMFEATLLNDIDDKKLHDMEALRAAQINELGERFSEYAFAREKYRILYKISKDKSPRRVILAIGKPTECPECHAKIPWNREPKKREVKPDA
jgi:hypothetical protein